MTVIDLIRILKGLPEELGECEIYIGGGPNLPLARVVMIVPPMAGDPISPRVELRDALVYRTSHPGQARGHHSDTDPDGDSGG